MDLETKYFDNFIILENDGRKILESKIELHNININVRIILSKNIVANFEINQCIIIINNFLKMFEGEKILSLTMEEFIEGIDFSNIVMDYKNKKTILIINYNGAEIEFEFKRLFSICVAKQK